MIITVDPLDTLFFRDGKPFTAGQSSGGAGFFPPLPSTLFGAMRTSYISYGGSLDAFIAGRMRSSIGTPRDAAIGSFRLKAICLRQEIRYLFPSPLDTAIYPGDRKRLYKIPLLEKQDFFLTNSACPYLAIPTDEEYTGTPERTYLDDLSMAEYLAGDNSHLAFLPLANLVQAEPKIGIMRDNATLTSQEHYLYALDMSRLGQLNPDNTISKVYLMAEFAGLDDFPEKGFMKLGGEAKTARFTRSSGSLLPQIKPEALARIGQGRKLKLYLLTPAIFDNGWLPSCLDSSRVWKGGDWEIQLAGAVTGRPLYVGGWDIQEKAPKTMRRAVPGASVYYFKILSGNPEKIIGDLHGANISDHLSEQGFGCVLAGVW